MKRLGVDTKTLLQSAVEKKHGGVRVQEFAMFWMNMVEKQETQDFLFDLLKKFLEDIDRADKHTHEGKSGINLGSYVNTTQFICLFLPQGEGATNRAVAATPQIKRWLNNWKKKDDGQKLTQKFPAIKNVISSLKAIQEGKDLYNSSIIGCSTLHTVDEFRKLLDIVENPTANSDSIKSSEQCFLYGFLCKLARANIEQRMAILTQTRNKVQSMSSQLKINPRLAETTLLALLHMMQNFMAIAPVTDIAFLKRTMTTIQQFYLWPCPYGNVTRNLLELLHHEMMCPGATWVSSFRADYPGAMYKMNKKNYKALYYMTLSDNSEGRMWTKIMQLRLRTSSEKGRRMSAGLGNMKVKARKLDGDSQAMIILHMLHNAGLTKDDDVKNFEQLKDVQVNTLFIKLEEIIAESNNFQSPQEAQENQKKKLTHIQEELATMATEPKPGRKIKFGETPKPPYFVSLPPVAHLLADCKSVDMSPERIDMLRMQQIHYRPYLLFNDMEELFSSILSEYSKKPKPLTLRLVIAGNDQLVSILLNTYLRIGQTNPRWLQSVNVKFLLVPWGDNSLASFIARHDSWYHRHIYVPFRGTAPFMIPWIDPEDMERAKLDVQDPGPLLPPAIFLRDTMNLYAREAKSICPIAVYKLEGWKPKTEDPPLSSQDEPDLPDDLIGFCMRVEIGQRVTERETKEPGGIFNPPDMDLTFTPMNLAGENQESLSEEGININNLLIANVPREKDKCFPPNPVCPWLEMYAEPKSGAKHLATDQKQHISELTLGCNNPTAVFKVRVDGQLFGPYNRITISRATMKKEGGSSGSPNEKKQREEEKTSPHEEIPFTLDIQTFFEINI